jgi:Bacterial extracellular solute-binding protein
VTATFNPGGYKTKAGKLIYVDAIAEGSGECIDKIINDSQKADLVSPASEVFVRLGNTEGRAKLGREVIGPTKDLVLSPVVIGIWEPMAKALGWPDKPIGWSDILGLATALDLLSFMSDADSFSIMPFNSRVLRDEEPQPLSDYRPTAEQILSSLFASGGCSLRHTFACLSACRAAARGRPFADRDPCGVK